MKKRSVGRPKLFPNEEMVFDAFRMPKSLRDRFSELAKSLKHNKSEIIRTAIENYIKEQETRSEIETNSAA